MPDEKTPKQTAQELPAIKNLIELEVGLESLGKLETMVKKYDGDIELSKAKIEILNDHIATKFGKVWDEAEAAAKAEFEAKLTEIQNRKKQAKKK